MRIASRVRKIYERRPYPPVPVREELDRWVLPPVEWIEAVREAPARPVRRILVAGCGVGIEAFALAGRFPAAEVVGVDFSPRSIATARRLQRRIDGGERVRFEFADLAGSRLKDITGGEFDLVSCHGVLSYIPETVTVLRNFRLCMVRTGALVLGVNGAGHPSLRFRRAMPLFGIDPSEFRESKQDREVLGLLDSLSLYPPVELAGQTAGYLASDLFGPLNQALPLSEWAGVCREAGLYLRGNFDTNFAIRAVLNRDQHKLLMPRSRAEVSELVDAIQPASFHRMVLSQRRSMEPPWSSGRSLLGWRPILTSLFKVRLPIRSGAWYHMRQPTLKSSATNTKVSLRVPEWQVEILRQAQGERSLREILDRVTPRVPAGALSEALYLLYQLGAINLLPE